MNLTKLNNISDTLPTTLKWVAEVESSFSTGASAPQLSFALFLCPRSIMVGVLESRKARRTLYAVFQSNTSIARGLKAFGDGLETIVQEAIMPKSNVAHLRPANNQSPFTVPETDKVIPLDELVSNLPEFLETALSYIISDFNYHDNIESNTAVAVRILAATVDRLNTSLEQYHG